MRDQLPRIQRTRATVISTLLVAPMIFGCGLLSTVNQNLSQTGYKLAGCDDSANVLDQAKPLVQTVFSRLVAS